MSTSCSFSAESIFRFMILLFSFFLSDFPSIMRVEILLARIVLYSDKGRPLEKYNIVSIGMLLTVCTEYILKRKDVHNNSNSSQKYFIGAKWRILFDWGTFVYANWYNLPWRRAVLINIEIRLNKYPYFSSSRMRHCVSLKSCSLFGLWTKCSVSS